MAQTSIRPTFSWMLIAVLACAMLALFVNMQLAFFALVFAAAGWWAWENPEEGFLFFVIIAPLLSMFKVTQTIGAVTLIKDVVILALFLRLFLIPLLQKRLPYRRSILFGPAVALVIWTVLQTLRADSLTLGILRARDIILYVLLYFTVLYLPADKQIWKRRLAWFTASFLVTVFHGAYQWFFADDSAVLRFDPGRQIWIPRLSSTFGHPSVYGEYLIAAATLFLAIVLCRPHFAKATRGRLRLVFYATLFFISLFLVYFTYSRAVWIGFAVAVGVMGILWLLQTPLSRWRSTTLPFARGGKLLVVLILAVAILTAGLLLRFTPAGPLLRSAFDPTYKSNQARLEFLARLIAPMSNVDAIIGRGLGDVVQQKLLQTNVSVEDIAGAASRDVQLAKDATLVDNQYLKGFVELGLLGLIIYFWLWWRFARGCWKLLRNHRSQITKHKLIIGLWGIGFLAAFVVQALFIDIWDIFPTNAMFWIVGGLVSAALTPYTKDYASREAAR